MATIDRKMDILRQPQEEKILLIVVFFLLGVVVEYPLLISSRNPMQKTFSLLSLNQLFANEKSPFNVSRFQFIA